MPPRKESRGHPLKVYLQILASCGMLCNNNDFLSSSKIKAQWREGTSERKRKAHAGYRKRRKFKGNGFTGSIQVKKTAYICSETNKDSLFTANLIGVRDASFTGLGRKQAPSTAEQSETPTSVSGQKILSRRKLD